MFNSTRQNIKAVCPRLRLMKKLSLNGMGKIIYIHAPAGYGKTVAAGLWLNSQPIEGATLTLDEYDNKMSGFCQRLCLALAALEPDNLRLKEYAFSPAFDRAPKEYTLRAVEALQGKAPACLVLDDLHNISSYDILQFIPALYRRFPPSLQLMLLSRAAPPESFGALVLKGELVQFTAEDLRFTEREIIYLFASNGRGISEEEARLLYNYTGGWAIGVGAVLLSGQPLPGSKLTHSYLDCFIKSQLWEKWGRRVRSFLLKTAFIDELTPELCTALTGDTNSAELLESLTARGAFISTSDHKTYMVHKLFRDFLLSVFEENSEAFRMRQYQLAADWYYKNGQLCQALNCYIRCEDAEYVASCLTQLIYFPVNDTVMIEKTLAIAKLPIMQKLSEKHWLFLSVHAWTSFLSGNAQEFERSLDAFYARYSLPPQDDPSALTAMCYLLCMDYRISLSQLRLPENIRKDQFNKTSIAGTITQNLPLFHRSTRDFSELSLGDTRAKVAQVKASISLLLGDAANLLECCMLAGIYYEKGDLVEAHSLALEANAKVRSHFTAENKFSAMLMLAHILRGLGLHDRARLAIEDIRALIEREEALYLIYSLESYVYACQITDGDTKAAAEWLSKTEANPFAEVNLYHLYGFFTTARAYICLNYYDRGIVILNKILELARAYRRPLDAIEAHVLIAMAYWLRRRGHQKKALGHLEQAIRIAAEYGYTQVFTDEAAGIQCMLQRLNTSMAEDPLADFVNRLYLLSCANSQNNRDTDALPAPVSLSPRQLGILHLLCEGDRCSQISAKLGLKYSTVRSHLAQTYKKLGVHNAAGAVSRAHELGLTQRSDRIIS